MTRVISLFAGLVLADPAAAQSAPDRWLPSTGYRGDVEVVVNGTPRSGRIIVTGDGEVHLELPDGEARRWANAIIRRATSPTRGWDDRTDTVRCVWGRLGPEVVISELHTPTASVRVTRHQPLPSRWTTPD